MKKTDLKPGMKVKNKISGSVGEVMGDKDGNLGYVSWCVGIRRRTMDWKNQRPL